MLFPAWFSLTFWFVLRLVIGVGDHMLHFSSQTWIGAMTAPEKRGRNMAIYGLFFSLGFAVGPQLVNLTHIGTAVPFFCFWCDGAGCLDARLVDSKCVYCGWG